MAPPLFGSRPPKEGKLIGLIFFLFLQEVKYKSAQEYFLPSTPSQTSNLSKLIRLFRRNRDTLTRSNVVRKTIISRTMVQQVIVNSDNNSFSISPWLTLLLRTTTAIVRYCQIQKTQYCRIIFFFSYITTRNRWSDARISIMLRKVDVYVIFLGHTTPIE